MASRSLKAGLAGFLDRGVPARSVHLAVGEGVETIDFARAAQLDEGHDFLVAGLEADGGSRRHIEPHSPRLGPLEAEGAIDLDVALTEDVLAWDHSSPLVLSMAPHPALSPKGERE